MRRKEPIHHVGYYHVGARGTYGRPLFVDDSEHELFLRLYAKTASKYGWETLAWALMRNHHHFLLRLVNGGLSDGMRALHSNFSRRMNAKYGLTNQGHLVRHCFFASEAMTLESIKSRARYIDLNPVKAGLCGQPADWQWSSYAATLGHVYPQPFHDPGELLALLDDDPRRARRAYRTFVQDGDGREEPDPWTEHGYEIVTDARRG